MFSIVNKNGEYKFSVSSKKTLKTLCAPPSDNYCESVHVFVELFGGRFVLQRKPLDEYPAGLLGSSTSGYRKFRESCTTTAKHKLYTDLGLSVNSEDLIKIADIKPEKHNDREFITLFTYLMDPVKEYIVMNEDQSSAIVIMSFGDLLSELDNIHTVGKYHKQFISLLNMYITLK